MLWHFNGLWEVNKLKIIFYTVSENRLAKDFRKDCGERIFLKIF